ncbi:MAG: hypothetical protein J6T73_04810 [Clostridia bacterium]|nr:hypothetical protein [Clostridia bacterium]
MSKKTILKVIAAICVMSLCFAAVFTGAVSAESASCSVTGYSYSPGAVDVYVGYEVTFTSSSLFTAGSFTITTPSDLRFIDCTPKASSIDGYVPNVYLNVTNNKVLFAGFSETASNDIQSFTSLTLVLKFTPTTAIKDSTAGKTWQITIGGISITNAAEATFSCAEANGTAHVHNFINATEEDGITTSTCSICSAVDKRVDPTATASLGTNTIVPKKNKKAVLSFTADGDTVLNAVVSKLIVDACGGETYFTYKYKDDSAEYKYATTTASGVIEIDEEEYYVFPCGRNGGIGRMGRNIVGNFINVNGDGTTISKDWEYSIKSYLEKIIETSEDADTVNYATALWNYGYYTTAYLAVDQPTFAEDRDSYEGGEKALASWTLPASKTAVATGTDASWTVSGIKIETGYKPKMHIKLNATGTAHVEAYSEAGDLVYKKSLAATADEYFTISDIPTKYLTGTIKITKDSSNKSVEYSFGKYAKARQGKDDGNVFKWMMNYAYYLNQAFA